MCECKKDNRRIIVACVGDSITFGSGAFDRNVTSYPPILESLLDPKDYIVYNFGLGSSTVTKAGTLFFFHYLFSIYYFITKTVRYFYLHIRR
jgi:hypothetical protein